MSQATPTTTYPFTYTTYSTSLSSTSFSKPTIIPSIFSFGPAFFCATNSIATPLPSQFPIDKPSGLDGACVISNAREINDHAFWDLYECCKGKDLHASGNPMACTAQCVAGDGQTWQELGECLSKRVEVVVCKPPFIEIGRNQTSSSMGSTTSATGTGQPAASGSGAQVSGSTGAGSTARVEHFMGPKPAVVVFGILAFGSVVGMLL